MEQHTFHRSIVLFWRVHSHWRSAALHDVPTLDEAGLKGFSLGTWFGVLAPAATPKNIVTRLNAEMVKTSQRGQSDYGVM